MAKLLFMGVHGWADPTNAAMPFIMATTPPKIADLMAWADSTASF